MKRAIAFLGLGLMMLAGCSDSGAAAVGVAEAQSNGRPDVSQRIFGHFFPADFDFDENEVHYLLNAIANGNPGRATVGGWIVYEPSGSPDEACPEGTLRYNVTRFEWGEIYNDGSLLRGGIDPGQFFCGSEEGNTGEITGIILGGKGRFEGASGTWVASTEASENGLIATLVVYFN